MQILLCDFGWHSRMGRFVHRRGDIYVSQCRRCNAPLVRKASGKWTEAK
jgi:hypothetical protein